METEEPRSGVKRSDLKDPEAQTGRGAVGPGRAVPLAPPGPLSSFDCHEPKRQTLFWGRLMGNGRETQESRDFGGLNRPL